MSMLCLGIRVLSYYWVLFDALLRRMESVFVHYQHNNLIYV